MGPSPQPEHGSDHYGPEVGDRKVQRFVEAGSCVVMNWLLLSGSSQSIPNISPATPHTGIPMLIGPTNLSIQGQDIWLDLLQPQRYLLLLPRIRDVIHKNLDERPTGTNKKHQRDDEEKDGALCQPLSIRHVA